MPEGAHMEWTQALTIIASMFAMMLWSMRERRADYLYTMKLIDEIHEEMKDFHVKLAMQDFEFKSRLTAIEERRK